MNEVAKQIEKLKVVPVVAIESVDDAERLADALTEGGMPCAEITLRTEAGLAAIKSLAKRCLLYTSPSPRDQRGARMPSSA